MQPSAASIEGREKMSRRWLAAMAACSLGALALHGTGGASAGAGPRCLGRQATIVGTSSGEQINGTAAPT